MASSSKTLKMELSHFDSNDKPGWMSDYNGDMEKIDRLAGGHITNKENPHDVTAGQVGSYTKNEVDGLLVQKANTGTPEIYNVSFTANLSVHRSAFYYKDSFGTVKLHIGVKTSNGVAFTEWHKITTLPVGFRPPVEVEVPALFSGIGGQICTGIFLVSPSGAVSIHVGSASLIAVLDCSFPTLE